MATGLDCKVYKGAAGAGGRITLARPASVLALSALGTAIFFVFPNAKAVAEAQLRSSPAYVPTPTLGSDSTPAPGVQPAPIELVEAEEQRTAEPPAAPPPASR